MLALRWALLGRWGGHLRVLVFLGLVACTMAWGNLGIDATMRLQLAGPVVFAYWIGWVLGHRSR